MNHRRMAALAAVGALVLAGCGSQAATSNTTGGANGTAQQTAGGGPDFSSLAKALGVSTAKLQAALQKARPRQAPQAGSSDDMAATLAQELGLTTAKVKAALTQFMPQGGPPPGGGAGQAPPSGTQS
jgi:hypothetical protein